MKAFRAYPSTEIRQIFNSEDSSQESLMLVVYPLPPLGTRYPDRRGSGLFILNQAFGDASVEINRHRSTLFLLTRDIGTGSHAITL